MRRDEFAEHSKARLGHAATQRPTPGNTLRVASRKGYGTRRQWSPDIATASLACKDRDVSVFAFTEVVCKSGCGGGTSVAVWAALAAVAAAFGVAVGLLQLRPFLRSAVMSQQANAIVAVSHCAERYHDIMRDVANETLGAKDTDVLPGSWWYRYWDLHTEQFTLFKQGLLDPRVYELWMNELATPYDEAPRGYDGRIVATRAVAHAAYLDRTLPHHVDLQSFFRQLSGIAFDGNPASRGAQVRGLINASAPKKQTGRTTIAAWVRHSIHREPDYQVIVSRAAIRERVRVLARVIESSYAPDDFVVVEVEDGATRFTSDLTRAMTRPVERIPIKAASQASGAKAGPVIISKREELGRVEGRNVLIVDDLLETGETLATVKEEVAKHAPASTAVCVLLSKPGKATVQLRPNYVGFGSLPDEKYVVGYGIDSDGRYRDLPDISAVEAGSLLPALGGPRTDGATMRLAAM